MKNRAIIIVFLCLIILATVSGLLADEPAAKDLPEKDQPVNVVVVKGAIFTATEKYIERGIKQAEREGAICVIQLDTPGGLVSSMREIIQDISHSTVPVVVFVYPQGAMATSAGTYITYAAHVAAMAPGTHIGSAHPVSLEKENKRRKSSEEEDEEEDTSTPKQTASPKPTGKGSPSPVVSSSPSPSPTAKKYKKPDGSEEVDVGMEKATNAMVALIRSLAEKNGRNADWGEKAVRESVSVTATEAVDLHVVEILANDVPDLLEKLKGRKVTLANKKVVTLMPAQDKVKYIEMTAVERFLLMLNDPQIAVILMMMGILGIYYELSNPGAAIPAIVGGICLILALYTLGSLPINYTALALIILAMILFIAEALSSTHGAFAVGGTIAFILGLVFLVPADIPYLRISKSFIITMGILMGAMAFLIVTVVSRTLKAKAKTGEQGLIGKHATVKTVLDPQGMVLMDGELWKAKTSEDIVQVGKEVIVEAVQGLLLTVKELTDSSEQKKSKD